MVSSSQLLIYARDGFKNVCNHVFMSLSSIVTLVIMLSFCALFVLFAENTNQFTRDIESEVTIFVELNMDVTREEIDFALNTLDSHDFVSNVDFRDRYEEHEHVLGLLAGDNEAVIDILTNEENPLHDVLEVEVNDIDNISTVRTFLEEFDSVYFVSDPSDVATALSNTTSAIRNVILLLVAVLMVLAVFLIQNTIKVTIYARQEELTIMKLVGASVGHITIPFVVEGFIIGVIGSIVPILFIMIGYRVLYNASGGVFAINLFQLAPPEPLIYQIAFITGLISIAVSLIGSLLAVAKYALKS